MGEGGTIDREVQGSLKFRDSGLKSGSKLLLRPPQKERDVNTVVETEEEGAKAEGGEDEMDEFEGGEAEMAEGGSQTE